MRLPSVIVAPALSQIMGRATQSRAVPEKTRAPDAIKFATSLADRPTVAIHPRTPHRSPDGASRSWCLRNPPLGARNLDSAAAAWGAHRTKNTDDRPLLAQVFLTQAHMAGPAAHRERREIDAQTNLRVMCRHAIGTQHPEAALCDLSPNPVKQSRLLATADPLLAPTCTRSPTFSIHLSGSFR